MLSFLNRIYNKLSKPNLPLSWTLPTILSSQKQSYLQWCLENFSEIVAREDLIGSAHYLNLILDSGFSIKVTAISRVNVHFHIEFNDPNDDQNIHQNLLGVNVSKLSDVANSAVLSLIISYTQTLFRNNQLHRSRSFIQTYLERHGPNHVLSDIALAQEWSEGTSDDISLLVKSMASGGLDYLQYFKGRYCSKPFDEFEIRSDGEIFVCCPSFLPQSIGNIYRASSDKELLKSELFTKIRESISQQDFRYCRWLHCTNLKNGLPPVEKSSKFDYAPTTFRLSYDPTCNLWCPSCRTKKIVATGVERDKLLHLTESVVLPLLENGQDCMMSGYGDIFASKACRRILEVANRHEFPHLSFTLISNGVLFTESEWNKFPGIHKMVRSVRISIDASCKDTYDKVRLGGDWDILNQNLLFISHLRKLNIIKEFMISFVVQDCNFSEMPDFAHLGKDLGCDFVIFEPIMNWNTFTNFEFTNKAVHYKAHPLHEHFLKARAEILSVIPRRSPENLLRHGQPEYATLASGSLLAGLEENPRLVDFS